MMTCPNCGKRIFEDETCMYCNHSFRKRSHPYDTEQYQYFKTEYLKHANKAIVMKHGMKQFRISMEEAKQIVDSVANEMYEANNVRSKEQVAELLGEDEPIAITRKREQYNAKMLKRQKWTRIIFPILTVVFAYLLIKVHITDENRRLAGVFCVAFFVSLFGSGYAIYPKRLKKKDYYTFSLSAYLIHVFFYHVVLEAVLAGVFWFCVKYNVIYEYTFLIFVWLVLEFALLIYIVTQFLIKGTSYFSTEPGNYVYGYETPSFGTQTSDNQTYRTNVVYKIEMIEKIEQRLHSFVIYGKMTKKKTTRNRMAREVNKTEPVQVKKVKIPKIFGHYQELIQKLQKKYR